MNEPVRVLVVDDERVVREGCQRVLSGRGYHVETAENGRVALEVLARDPVDLILLDLKMPVMSGEELLEEVQDKYPDIPVIIITGHGTIDTAVECMKKGAYDFVTKPFQIEQFLLTINRAAEKRALEQRTRLYEQERRKDLYDLNLEKTRLRTIVNCIPNGVMVTNRNLEVVLHNPALMRLLEASGKAPLPLPVTRLIRNQELIAALKRILAGEAGREEFIAQEMEAAGHVLRAISAPALDPDGRAVGTVTVLEDITPFKQLDEMKSDFVNMVVHELRGPLVAIRQQHSVLLEGLTGPLTDKQKDFIGRGKRKIDQLLDLIRDLLDIAKLEAGRHVQHRIPINIAQVIEETVALLEPRARQQGVCLRAHCDKLPPVQADPKSIEEIFNNLLSNAINYSPDGGEVTVTARNQGAYMEISVRDTGVGIDPEELPKIFDKFYRVKHPRTRQIMGTGLGLAIVKGVVEAHQGTIDVQSTPEKGTTFRILLPVISEQSNTRPRG